MLPQSVSIPKSAAQRAEEAVLEEKRNSILSIFLTPDAKERLQRIAIVSPERAARVEAVLIQQIQSGKLAPKSVTDDMLKSLLEKFAESSTSGLVVGGLDVADEASGTGKVIISRRGADVFTTAIQEQGGHDGDDDEELSF